MLQLLLLDRQMFCRLTFQCTIYEQHLQGKTVWKILAIEIKRHKYNLINNPKEAVFLCPLNDNFSFTKTSSFLRDHASL